VTARAGDHGLAASPPAPSDPRLATAEARRRAALAEVDALDAEVERLAGLLGEFSRRYDAALGGAFAELADAERLVRRIQALEDELARLAARLRSGPDAGGPGSQTAGRGRGAREGAERLTARRAAAAAGTSGGEPGGSGAADADEGGAGGPDAAAEAEVEPLDEERALKQLHRRLARLFHPDLTGDEVERERLAGLMARVNEAYTRRDRAALELLAERAGAGDEIGDVSDEERLAHLRGRAAALQGIAAALRRERARFLESETWRLWEESRRRAGRGGDLLGETRRDLEVEAGEARADARHRLTRLWRAAAEVGRLWRKAMTGLVRQGAGGLRPFDPLAESPLVRHGVARLERQRASAAARDLARRLEEAAERTPWEAAAALMAFCAEEAGRPPESLAGPEGWAERWEVLRETWPDAPAFEQLLAHPPRHLRLELGLRASVGRAGGGADGGRRGARSGAQGGRTGSGGGEVTAGLQLAAPDLLAGVHLALAREPVARVARIVLGALGPRMACRRCRRPRLALHLVRTRGLDEVHGLACPDCGAVLRSYWRYGEPEGLEALAALALRVGLVAEQVVRLGGASLAFQMGSAERERLTAGRLRALFVELYLEPCRLDLDRSLVQVRAGGTVLTAGARVPSGVVRLAVAPGGGMSERELVDALRARIDRRFRPGAAR